MFFCLVIALLSTFFYVNILIAEIVNAKINVYGQQDENYRNEAIRRSKVKNILLIIMSLFWATIILWI